MVRRNGHTSESAFFKLRVLIGLFVFLGGVVLALFACGAFANVLAEAKVPAPGSTKAKETSATVSYTSRRVPIQGEGPVHILAADRPVKIIVPTAVGKRAGSAQPQTNPWRLQATLSGVVTDLAFPTASTGYAAAELGRRHGRGSFLIN